MRSQLRNMALSVGCTEMPDQGTDIDVPVMLRVHVLVDPIPRQKPARQIEMCIVDIRDRDK
tara:strand:+ start:74 stop:256 length:183 start_codon:yes stop_codon:yes gene_type:complete